MRTLGREIVLRGAHDSLPLLPPNARRRSAVVALGARTNFDEYQRAVALAHDEIDLAAAARHIARDEPQTLALQKLLRARLESRADEFGPGLPRKVVEGGASQLGSRTRRIRASRVDRTAWRCVAQ